jgi:asparagine synthase (glutamine-hydrolysing)
VLRDALKGIVPDLILDRPDKLGFASPLGNWVSGLVVPALKGPLGNHDRLAPFVNPTIVKRWITERNTDVHDGQAERLWRLFILLKWQEQFKITI